MLCCKQNIMTILTLGALAVSAGAQTRKQDVGVRRGAQAGCQACGREAGEFCPSHRAAAG